MLFSGIMMLLMRRDDDNGESVKRWVVVSNYRSFEACELVSIIIPDSKDLLDIYILL